MSLRPLKGVQKFLFSTTSHLIGEFEVDFALITHAWPGSRNKNAKSRWLDGPASRNAFVFSFRTEEAGGIQDYSPVGEMICGYLAVLFGKRFDHHGLIEGNGFFQLPDLMDFGHVCRHNIPHNSRDIRVDLGIPLNLVEVERIKALLMVGGVEKKFLRTFQSASKFYLQALQFAERDPEIAYLNLITAIEVLSNFYEFDKIDLLDSDLRNVMQRIKTELAGGEKIAELFLNRLLQIKKRFVKTVLSLIDESFFTRTEASDTLFSFKSESFGKCISAAYDLRSKYIHTGVPFGTWIISGMGGQNKEVHVGQLIVEGDKELGKLIGLAPTFVGLERVTRYVLLLAAAEQGAYVAQ